MFRINPSPTFPLDVSITTPTGPATLSLECRHQGKKALAAWAERLNSDSDIEAIAHIVAGWHGVVDESGALVDYSPETLAMVLDRYLLAAQEIFVAYIKALREGREKN